MEIGDRHLGGRDEEIVFIAEAKQILLEFGKLAGSNHRRSVDHERRENFPIPMPSGVEIEHIVDQCPFEPGTRSGKNGKSCSGDLRGSIKIQNAKCLTNVPVRLWSGCRLRSSSAGAHFYVARWVSPDRHGGVREIGDAQVEI